MTNNDELAIKLKSAAEKAGAEEWKVKRNGPGEYGVMVKGSLVKYSGWSTHRPVADEVVDKKTADFIATASPANILSLLAERDADKKRIADMQAIVDAAEKLVRCKGRYHSEQNYRALAALFGVKTPDLPPLETEARSLSVSGNRIKRRESEFWISLEYIANKLLESGIKLEVGE